MGAKDRGRLSYLLGLLAESQGSAEEALQKYELALDEGAPERARGILQRCTDPPASLLSRVEQACAQERLEALRLASALKQVDVTYDARRRRLVLAIFGPLWPLGWFVLALAPRQSAGSCSGGSQW